MIHLYVSYVWFQSEVGDFHFDEAQALVKKRGSSVLAVFFICYSFVSFLEQDAQIFEARIFGDLIHVFFKNSLRQI